MNACNPLPDNCTPAPGVSRTSLRDAVAVLVSSADILSAHYDRLPKDRRIAQLAALSSAAAEVELHVDLLLVRTP